MKKLFVAAFLCGIMLLGGADGRAAEQTGEVQELREMVEEQSRVIGELLLRIEALEA